MKTPKEAAMEFLRQHWHVSPSQELEDPDGMEVFLAGDANGFRRAIEMLRSDEPKTEDPDSDSWFHEAADWLEKQKEKL